MVNKPKKIGTAGETGVKRYAQSNGFPLADRRTQEGSNDPGDILLTVGCLLEVKAGAMAHRCEPGAFEDWVAQSHAERINAGADIVMLVVAKRGYAPSRAGYWRCFILEPWRLFHPILVNGLTLEPDSAREHRVAARVWGVLPAVLETTLEEGLRTLRRAGWGEPLDKVT